MSSVYIAAVLCLVVAVSEWLSRRSFMRYLDTSLLAIILAAVVANAGLIPTGSTPEAPVAVYEGIFGIIAPLAVFYLLLPVNLRDILKAGSSMIVLFLAGTVGTALGVLVGMFVLDGASVFGEQFYALGGMFVGTYSGGSVNFNALALHYDIVREGALYGGAVAVDNIITALWMMASIAIPRILAPYWKRSTRTLSFSPDFFAPPAGADTDAESVDPMQLTGVLALGLAALWLSQVISAAFAAAGLNVPSIVVVTVLALICAQLPFFQNLHGSRLLGAFAVYLFLAVIGAFCDIRALASLGRLGLALFALTLIIVVVHVAVLLAAARLMKTDLDMAMVASQANIGGPPSALALARSLGRTDLALPAVLLGALGYAVGTFAGLAFSEWVMTAVF